MKKHAFGIFSFVLCSLTLASAGGCASFSRHSNQEAGTVENSVVKDQGYFVDSQTAKQYGGIGNYIPRNALDQHKQIRSQEAGTQEVQDSYNGCY